jgi:hypothetical protein
MFTRQLASKLLMQPFNTTVDADRYWLTASCRGR